MKMDLLDFYKSLLTTAGMTVVDEDYVSLLAGNKGPLPAEVDGKLLVLPTPRQLRAGDFENRVVFHPMSENIMHGESKVLAFFRECLNARLNVVFNMLLLELTQIATSTKDHALLNPDQAEFLSLVKETDDRTFEYVVKLAQEIDGTVPQRAIVWIYLKRPIMINGRKASRGAVVSFPLYEELLRAEKTKNYSVFGVTLRAKDVHTLRALMEYIVPQINQPEKFLIGSDATTAPFLEVLMQAVKSVAAPLNDLVDLFGDQLSSAEKMRFEDSWVEAVENLGVLRDQARAVPMQAGNEGAATDAPAQPQPASRPATGPTFAAAPAPTQPMAAPGFPGQPVALHPQTQQTGPQTPQIVKTAGGLDFNSVLQANPVLNYMVSQQAGMFPGMGMNLQMNRQPRWAQPGNPMYSSGMAPQMQPQGQMLTGGAYPQQQFVQPMQPAQQGFGFQGRGFGTGI